jgi:hypothetical protein
MPRRLIGIVAAVAALVLPAAAAAAPTAPHLQPLPASTLAQTLTVSWTGSWFDPGYPNHAYLVTVWEYPFGGAAPTYRSFSTDALSVTIDVHGPSRYQVLLSAVEWKTGYPVDIQVASGGSAWVTVWTLPADPPVKG